MIGHITLLQKKKCDFCGRRFETLQTQKGILSVCSKPKCLFAEADYKRKLKEVSQNAVCNY